MQNIYLSATQNLVGLSNTVAMDFGRALFGPLGGTLFAFMVAFSCFGALNGMLSLFLKSLADFSSRVLLYLFSACICCGP
jgi:hypothetical protein